MPYFTIFRLFKCLILLFLSFPNALFYHFIKTGSKILLILSFLWQFLHKLHLVKNLTLTLIHIR